MQEGLDLIRHAAHGIAHGSDAAFDAVHNAHDHVLAPLQGFGREARNEADGVIESFLDGGHDFPHRSLYAAPYIVEHRSDRIFNAVHHT